MDHHSYHKDHKGESELKEGHTPILMLATGTVPPPISNSARWLNSTLVSPFQLLFNLSLEQAILPANNLEADLPHYTVPYSPTVWIETLAWFESLSMSYDSRANPVSNLQPIEGYIHPRLCETSSGLQTRAIATASSSKPRLRFRDGTSLSIRHTKHVAPLPAYNPRNN